MYCPTDQTGSSTHKLRKITNPQRGQSAPWPRFTTIRNANSRCSDQPTGRTTKGPSHHSRQNTGCLSSHRLRTHCAYYSTGAGVKRPAREGITHIHLMPGEERVGLHLDSPHATMACTGTEQHPTGHVTPAGKAESASWHAFIKRQFLLLHCTYASSRLTQSAEARVK
jgi:hypothetical protein